MSEYKVRHCFNCGMTLGCYADADPLDHCGSRACMRAARECREQEREEAREKLDRDRG